jgi:hypothetical protein
MLPRTLASVPAPGYEQDYMHCGEAALPILGHEMRAGRPNDRDILERQAYEGWNTKLNRQLTCGL